MVSLQNKRVGAHGDVWVRVRVPRETWAKVQRGRISWDGENNAEEALTNRAGVSNLLEIRWKPMPDQPSPDKVSLSVRVPRTLAQRLKRLAAQRNEPVSELLSWLFTKATNEVELTPDDYRQIAEDTERALKMQAAKGSARKALDARYKEPKGE